MDEILIRDNNNSITHVFRGGKLYTYSAGKETLVETTSVEALPEPDDTYTGAETKAHPHIAHISTAGSVELVNAAKKKGKDKWTSL
jgi:dihydroorotase-like cyclic amidohydrolase